MNCDTVDSILDERRSARLHAAERQGVAAHLAGCARCADNWAAHEALAGEQIPEPPPELFARMLGRVDECARPQATRRRGWRIGAAAAAAVALVAVVGYSARDPGAGADDAAPAAPQSTTAAAAPRFVAGRHYEVLANAAPLAATADGVAVLEFFSYACFPCNAFEPELERYRAASLGRVALTRVPAVFNREAELLARAFYTAEALGKLDAMHAAFYDEIHVRDNRLASRAALAELFARFGVDAAAFDAAFDSSGVTARVQRAIAMAQEYDVRATPSLVVAGTYATNPTMAGPALLAVVDELVAAEAPCAVRCDSLRSPRAQADPVPPESIGEQ